MTDITTVVHSYIAMWNETTPEDRRAIIADTFADDARYLDPLQSGDGPAGIDAMVAAAQKQFPGHRFELSAGPDAHHDRVRFAWRLVGDGGARSPRESTSPPSPTTAASATSPASSSRPPSLRRAHTGPVAQRSEQRTHNPSDGGSNPPRPNRARW
jgi:hypothetical protein